MRRADAYDSYLAPCPPSLSYFEKQEHRSSPYCSVNRSQFLPISLLTIPIQKMYDIPQQHVALSKTTLHETLSQDP